MLGIANQLSPIFKPRSLHAVDTNLPLAQSNCIIMLRLLASSTRYQLPLRKISPLHSCGQLVQSRTQIRAKCHDSSNIHLKPVEKGQLATSNLYVNSKFQILTWGLIYRYRHTKQQGRFVDHQFERGRGREIFIMYVCSCRQIFKCIKDDNLAPFFPRRRRAQLLLY